MSRYGPKHGLSPRALDMVDAPPLVLQGFDCGFAALAQQIAGKRIGVYADRFSDHRIFVMLGIAEIWRAAADNTIPSQRFGRLRRDEALEELALVIETAEIRRRKAPHDAARKLQLDQLIAMRWWHAAYLPSAYFLNMALNLRYDAGRLSAAAQAEENRERPAA
ncbi:hypothetical protein O4H52_00920 [Sphingomonadaceae bacterium G21617-S1]|nr:hypothetical protein [Sphingomonadaceae bacterium G21617-S1]